MPYEPMSDEALRKIIRDINNITPAELSFNELMKELNNDN